MADSITDGRTLIDDAEAVTPYVDLGGTGAGSLDDEIFFENAGSIGLDIGSTLDGILYDAGSAQDWSDNTFYFLINCGIVGLLAAKASGGFRIRFCGATVSNWFEVYVGGNDSWPASFAGGWSLFVVDIETAAAEAATNGWENGTVPATSAIQYVGWAGITGGTMPRMVDNTWMDAMYRLPDGTAAIIIQGDNTAADWTWDDVLTEMAAVDSPVARLGSGGAITLSGPVSVGANDSVTHSFIDTNRIILWDDQEFIPDDLYTLSAIGNAGGTTTIEMGIKTGTGLTASGAQGCTIAAAALGGRWNMDFDDPNIDTVGFYGCSLQHIEDAQLDDAAVDIISSLVIDSTILTLPNANFLKNKIITPNTIATEAAIADGGVLDDILVGEFVSGGNGYAVEISVSATEAQAWDAIHSGYAGTDGSTGNETILVNITSPDVLTINVSDFGATPTIHKVGTGTVTVVAGQKTFKFTVNPSITAYEWRIYEDSGVPGELGTVELDGEESAIADNQTYTYSYSSDTAIVVQIIAEGYEEYTHYDTLLNGNKDLTFNLTVEDNT